MSRVRLKRKMFIFPAVLAAAAPVMSGLGTAVGTAGTVLTGVSMYQSGKQADAQAEQAEAQLRATKAQTKAINELADVAQNNPIAAMQASQVMQKTMSNNYNSRGSILEKNFGIGAGTFLKDFGKAFLWNKDGGIVKDSLKFAGIGGALSYGANKWIQYDMERNGLSLPNAAQNMATAVKAQPKQLQYSAAPSNTSPSNTPVPEGGGGGILGGAIGLVFNGQQAASSLMGYYGQKKALIEQKKATMKSYSKHAPSILSKQKQFGGIGTTLKSLGKDLVYGMGLGNPQQMKDKAQIFTNSTSSLSKGFGEILDKHPKAVAMAGIPIGMGTMGYVWDAGEKVMEKPFEMVDKNAFAWDKSQANLVD